jgi:hypothetical protein
MKLFYVIYFSEYTEDFMGVFSSKESAEEFISKRLYFPSNAEIRECTLDKEIVK